MTAMGKMLAFLVFILAIAWVVFGVNAYVTRVNWEARALKAEKSAKDAAESATKMKDLYEITVASHADQLRASQAERDRLYNQVAVLSKERDSLQQQFNQAFGNAQQANVAIKNLQTNLKSVQDQVDELDKSVAAKNTELNDLSKKAAEDRVARGEAERTAIEFRQQADRLGDKLATLNEELQSYKRQYGPLTGQLGGAASLPDGFRGTVTTVELVGGGDMLVTLTPGADAGVRKGAVMTVYGVRNGAAKHLGTVQILSADPKSSVGRFVPPANRGVLVRDDYPRAGDELKPK